MNRAGDYKHIIFDLDNTLWDFNANAEKVLTFLFSHYGLEQHGKVTLQAFVEKFREINTLMWQYFQEGKYDREMIRQNRFKAIFKALNIPDSKMPDDFADRFLELCPQQGTVIPYTFELLDYLKSNYKLHILTNGFEDVQFTKLKSSGLDYYFDVIVTSDSTGARKPDNAIFHHIFQKIGTTADCCMMVGDSWESDILGAQHVNMDQTFFNPMDDPINIKPTFTIKCLSELKSIL